MGDQVAGGGFNTGNASVVVTASYASSATEWTVNVTNNDAAAQDVTAYVVCADMS